MIGEWLACRLPTLEHDDTRRLRSIRFGRQIFFGSVGFEVFELQLHLLERITRRAQCRPVRQIKATRLPHHHRRRSIRQPLN
jgi:hypothetical protein